MTIATGTICIAPQHQPPPPFSIHNLSPVLIGKAQLCNPGGSLRYGKGDGPPLPPGVQGSRPTDWRREGRRGRAGTTADAAATGKHQPLPGPRVLGRWCETHGPQCRRRSLENQPCAGRCLATEKAAGSRDWRRRMPAQLGRGSGACHAIRRREPVHSHGERVKASAVATAAAFSGQRAPGKLIARPRRCWATDRASHLLGPAPQARPWPGVLGCIRPAAACCFQVDSTPLAARDTFAPGDF